MGGARTQAQERAGAAGSAVAGWLRERLGLTGLAYAVPEHANSLPYLLGGITLAGLVILFVTGIYLAQF